MATDTKKVGMTTTISILAIYFVSQTAIIVNPAIAAIAAQYPEIPLSTITFVATLTSLITIPCALVAGAMAGTKVKYKTLAVLSIALLAFGGAAAYFATSFPMILVTRLFVGAGIGISTPISSAVVMRVYDEKHTATMNGIGAAMQNIAGVLLQMISGYLVTLSLSYCWLLHLIMIIPLVLVILFFKEPAKAEAAAVAASEKSAPAKAKSKLPIAVIIFSVAYGLTFMCYYPVLIDMSSIVIGENIGDAALAGTIGSMYSLGGMLAGFAFGAIYKALGRRFTIPVSMIVITVCMALIAFTKVPALLMAGVLISGFGFFVIWPASIMEFGAICPPERIAFASGLFFAVLNTGSFLASIYLGIVASVSGSADPRIALVVGTVIVAVITVIWSLIIIGKKNKEAENAVEAA